MNDIARHEMAMRQLRSVTGLGELTMMQSQGGRMADLGAEADLIMKTVSEILSGRVLRADLAKATDPNQLSLDFGPDFHG